MYSSAFSYQKHPQPTPPSIPPPLPPMMSSKMANYSKAEVSSTFERQLNRERFIDQKLDLIGQSRQNLHEDACLESQLLQLPDLTASKRLYRVSDAFKKLLK